MSTDIDEIDSYKVGDKTNHGGTCIASIHITAMKEEYNSLKIAVTTNISDEIDLKKLEEIFDLAKKKAINRKEKTMS